MYTWYRLG
jgi:hypothetical protein